ncbi:MAG: 50S ribosomal protein L3 [Christensenellales bacterium]
MKKAILGRKLGMSQIFTADGTMIPVTVVEAGPCPVVQVKTAAKEGYDAVQIAFGEIKEKNVTAPLKGHYAKAGVNAKRALRECRFDDCSAYEVGKVITCDSFAEGDKVDVIGTTRGRGYTGVIQRWNAQRIGSMTHGTGPIHRSVGSMGANSDPSRVFKNKHMAGQYGNERVTIKNLEVVRVDAARNLLLIKGGIPGAKGSLVFVKA